VTAEAEESYVVIHQERAVFCQQNGNAGVSTLAGRANSTVGECEASVIVPPYFIAERLLLDPVIYGPEVTLSDADDFNSEGIKLSFEVTEPATFDRSAIRPGGWKEPQDRRASDNVGRTS
jgi:hypothetical protein